MCMAYCAGGTNLPWAKRNFYPAGIWSAEEFGDPGYPYPVYHPLVGEVVKLNYKNSS